MSVLEYAIHKNNGNTERTIKWIDRWNLSQEEKQSILAKVQFGDFLAFNGSRVDHIDNPQFKYENI